MDDGIPLEDGKVPETAPPDVNGYCVDDMISKAKLRADARIGSATWQEEVTNTMDVTRVLYVMTVDVRFCCIWQAE